MRIFFAVPRSAWVDLNLRRSLEDMGHQLVRFDFPGWPDPADRHWQRIGKPQTNERLLAAFRAASKHRPVDLLYGYFYSSVVYPETIDLIRQSGVPTVNFSCNNVHQFDLVRDIASHFDVCVVPERSALGDFEAVGARPVRIQLAANPRVYHPYPTPRIYDVAFVGQRYADRAEFLGYLHCQGIRVRAWGAGWQTRKRFDLAHARAALALVEDERLDGVRRLIQRRSAGRDTQGAQHRSVGGNAQGAQHRPVGGNMQGAQHRPAGSNAQGAQHRSVGGDTPGALDQAASPPVDTSAFGGPRLLQTDLVKNYSQSRISLGFATAGNSHLAHKRLTHLRLREFEAPMSGALYLTEQQAELEEYFQPGTEVLTYANRQDLLDQARYYLAHQEQAERIRRAGFVRARRDHTWQHRFADLFRTLGLRDRA